MIRASSSERPAPRGGFTLVEMLLVLAVLLVIAALTVPSLSRLYGEHQLRWSADTLRVQLTAARVHALETGLVYHFRYEPGGRRFVVLPAEAGVAPEGSNTVWKVAGELPPTVTFPTGATTQSLPVELFEGLHEAADLGGCDWSPPHEFQPDGSTTAYTIEVRDKQERQVSVSVRELTGTVSASAIRKGASR